MRHVDFQSPTIRRLYLSLSSSQLEMTLMTSENKGKVVNYGSLEDLMVMNNKRENGKIKWLIGLQICTILFILLMIGTFFFFSHSMMKTTQPSANTTHDDSEPGKNIVTLYALDPLARTFSFGDGKYGEMFENWSVYNRRSDIDFNTYNSGNFSVGIEGAEVGTIVDLGSSAELQKKYKYQETVGNGQGFASIHRKNKTLLILKGHSYNQSFQPMEESTQLFREGRSGATVPVRLGHLYALRITDHTDAVFERIVKMLVIAYQPSEMVTIRWEVLL